MDNIKSDVIFLNDYIEEHPDKTYAEIRDILHGSGISYKRMKIKFPCSVCGADVIVRPSDIRKHTVSFRCEKHKRIVKKGGEHPQYKRVECVCTNCGNTFFRTPSQIKRVNKFGEQNVFCCRKCYSEFRHKYYVGEKGAMYQHVYTEEQRKNLSRGVVKRASSAERLNSSIQKTVDKILDELNVLYQREMPFDFYSCDNYLPDQNLIIEVMGDYWHSNPNRYSHSGRMINNIQARGILKDKQKFSYIDNHYHIPILYLWETDIKTDPEKCKRLICRFIQWRSLPNYHSFNYTLDNNNLHFTDEIVTPYQDLPVSEYKSLIKPLRIRTD